MSRRILRGWVASPGAEPVNALAMTRADFRRLLGLRSDEAVKDAIERLTAAGHLVPATDGRPERWVKRPAWQKAGPSRTRMLVFVGTIDPLMVARWYKALVWDERHPAPPGTRWADPSRR